MGFAIRTALPRKENNVKVSKATAQFKHARRRMWQRYHIQLLRHDYDLLCSRIRKGGEDVSIFVGRQTLRVTLWWVRFQGLFFPVVYDNKRHTIVTFLTCNMMRIQERIYA